MLEARNLSCFTCFLDVQVDTHIVESNPNYQIVIITTWQYMAIGSAPILILDNKGHLAQEFDSGDIRDAYEGVTDTPFHSILGLGEAWRCMRRSGVLTRP